MNIVETFIVGPLEENCYLLYDETSREASLIDPGADPEKILDFINKHNLTLKNIIITHGHWDHVGAIDHVKHATGAPVHIHKLDMGTVSAENFLKEGDAVVIGNAQYKVIHTPGHSPGSVSLVGDGFLLTGDLLFCGGVGRTDLPGGSWSVLEESIRHKIYSFPDATEVLPGHGPTTTIGQEKLSNPFVR